MASVNKVTILGNLTRDPEVSYLASGKAVCNISIATSESWRDKASGDRKERTEWHRVQYWGKTAEALAEYLVKGKQVYVEGKIQTRKWKDQAGTERVTTEIRADRLVLLGGKDRSGEMRDRHVKDEEIGHGEPSITHGPVIEDSDIPF